MAPILELTMTLMALLLLTTMNRAEQSDGCVCPELDPNCQRCFRLPIKFGKRDLDLSDTDTDTKKALDSEVSEDELYDIICRMFRPNVVRPDYDQMCHKAIARFMQSKSKSKAMLLEKVFESLVRNRYYK